MSEAKAPFILETGPMSAETRKIAEVELNETPERSEEAVAELRRLLHENTDLYYRDDDEFLKTLLRPCHFYPESAIKLVSLSKSTKTHAKAKCIKKIESTNKQ